MYSKVAVKGFVKGISPQGYEEFEKTVVVISKLESRWMVNDLSDPTKLNPKHTVRRIRSN